MLTAAMQPLLYGELVPWYRLLDPVEDHREEAIVYAELFERLAAPRPETLLELGAGAGHNAFHLKRRFRCTLTDLSAPMQGLSRALNPECEHRLGDMRTLRLGRTFDVVLVHDAICYMVTRDDLRAAVETAFLHTRPGGAAIFAPDCLRDSFQERSALFEGREGSRSMRCLEWTWDPDPGDDTYTVEYAFLLREGTGLRAVHDRHLEGLFSRATWQEVLTSAGFEVELVGRPDEGGEGELLLCCRRP